MTQPALPRWEIHYRRAGEDELQKIIIPAESMITALKEAQMRLRGLIDGPFFIRFINQEPEEGTEAEAEFFAGLKALRAGGDHY